jgi:hypothetical protein
MEKTTITLELLMNGDGVSGRALGADGDAREFSGRLGLMHTIDELLAEASRQGGDDESDRDR